MEQNFRGKTPEENLAMQNFFHTLPPFVQEAICQSGVHFSNVQEMTNCAQQIMQQS